MKPLAIRAFESEWIKKRRSLGSWLVVIGAVFTPSVIVVARLIYPQAMGDVYSSPDFWTSLWHSAWESMAIFLMPMCVIMVTSLVTQLEYRNNTWKQLHTTPLSLATIFFSKLGVIVVMIVQFLMLFNLSVYLSAMIPLLVLDLPYPSGPFPYSYFLRDDLLYFVDCLPIVALQYALSLHFRNFLVPIGAGFLMWVASLASLSWKYGYVIPYTYNIYHYLKNQPGGRVVLPDVNFHYWALGYFVLFLCLGFAAYRTKREKV